MTLGMVKLKAKANNRLVVVLVGVNILASAKYITRLEC